MGVFFTDLPTAIQAAIQQGYLDRTFKMPLTARLGFRTIAERMDFPARLGQTITDTKRGLLPTATTPLAVRSLSDLDDGLTNASYPLEQYTIGVSQYGQSLQLQMASDAQVIQTLFLQNALALAEGAARTIDTLAYNALFNAYLGGNTYVTTTLGSAGTAVQVNDVRGFFESVNSSTSKVAATSSGNPLGVLINGTLYSCTAAVADGNAPATTDYTFANLTFSSSGSNTSTTPGGYSGVLTLTTNASTTNATAGNSVIASTAPFISRPYDPSSGVVRANSTKLVAGDVLTLRMIQAAVGQMRANGINDDLWCFLTDQQLITLWRDTEWRQYLQTRDTSEEFRDLKVGRVNGVNFTTNNIAQIDSSTVSGQNIHRAIVCANGSLVEADFTNHAYALGAQEDVSEVDVVDNVAHIIRPPLNRFADVLTQSWTTILGFVAPTDTTANSSVIPTASNASRKRACVIESVV